MTARTPIAVVEGLRRQLPDGDHLVDSAGNALFPNIRTIRMTIQGNNPGPGIEMQMNASNGHGYNNTGIVTTMSTVLQADESAQVGSGDGSVTYTTNAAGTGVVVEIGGQTVTNIMSVNVLGSSNTNATLNPMLKADTGMMDLSFSTPDGTAFILTDMTAGQRVDVLFSYITN